MKKRKRTPDFHRHQKKLKGKKIKKGKKQKKKKKI